MLYEVITADAGQGGVALRRVTAAPLQPLQPGAPASPYRPKTSAAPAPGPPFPSHRGGYHPRRWSTQQVFPPAVRFPSPAAAPSLPDVSPPSSGDPHPVPHRIGSGVANTLGPIGLVLTNRAESLIEVEQTNYSVAVR